MADDDRVYIAWIRSQPCAQCGRPPPSTAHHSTAHGRGMSQRASDRETVPLCHRHHMEFHDAKGWAHSMSKAERKAWQRTQVERYQKMYREAF